MKVKRKTIKVTEIFCKYHCYYKLLNITVVRVKYQSRKMKFKHTNRTPVELEGFGGGSGFAFLVWATSKRTSLGGGEQKF